MTVAAAYARFSSDSQRDESIEIQLEAITRFVESRGWTLGESYTDYAIRARARTAPLSTAASPTRSRAASTCSWCSRSTASPATSYSPRR